MRRFASVMILAMGLVGCGSMRSMMGHEGQRVALRPSESTPGAQGKIHVMKTDNQNSKVDIQVNHLPPANRLDPDTSRYMVWIDPGAGNPIPLGQLELDNNQSAEATLVTPFDSFELLVTAEPAGDPQQPSDTVVLRGQVGSRPGS